MKIKCPLCNYIVELGYMELSGHLYDAHETMSYDYLANLLFKIHKRIKHIEKAYRDKERTGFIALDELKSLLEKES